MVALSPSTAFFCMTWQRFNFIRPAIQGKVGLQLVYVDVLLKNALFRELGNLQVEGGTATQEENSTMASRMVLCNVFERIKSPTYTRMRHLRRESFVFRILLPFGNIQSHTPRTCFLDCLTYVTCKLGFTVPVRTYSSFPQLTVGDIRDGTT